MIDYYRGEAGKRSRWLEKMPLFLFSFCFGLIAIKAQHSTAAMMIGDQMDVPHRILAASYGIFTYIWKAILPINLSCLHPYPSSFSSDWSFYLRSFIVLALMVFVFIKRKKNPDLFFGILFFVISLLPVLQLLPVGVAIIAERYTYLAYIGLFFALFSFFPKKNLLTLPRIIVPVGIAGFIFLIISMNRCDIWKNSETLWTDVIDNYPECAIAYCNRGVAYSEIKQSDKAEKDYESAVRYDSVYKEALNNLGLIYYNSRRFDKALIYYNRAIKSDPEYGEAYNNRGVAMIRKGNKQEALSDFSKSVKFTPDYANAWLNKGNLLMEIGDTTEGLIDMKKAADFYLQQGNKEGYNHAKDLIGLHY
ncbi:MAG TPA: tetratricopeptide repeat protein [Bacteroidia bacterium]|nr:tetratricopeptide repeat protein [Bacteroidia bacterium]